MKENICKYSKKCDACKYIEKNIKILYLSSRNDVKNCFQIFVKLRELQE